MSDILHHLFFQVFLYTTGRIVIFPFSSFVKAKENMDESTNSGWRIGRFVHKKKAHKEKVHKKKVHRERVHKENDMRYITIEGLQLLGGLFWVFVITLLYNMKN